MFVDYGICRSGATDSATIADLNVSVQIWHTEFQPGDPVDFLRRE
jgi:hypothetical protein